MHCEYLLVNDCCDGQAIEAISKCLPQLDIVASFAFIVEPIYTIDGGALMIATQDEKVLWVFDLVGEQQADGLQRLLASVNIVPKEEIVCLWWEATILEQTEKVVILTMDVTTYLRSNQNQPVRVSNSSFDTRTSHIP